MLFVNKAFLWSSAASNCSFYTLPYFYCAKAAIHQTTTRWNKWVGCFQAWIVYLFSRREGAIAGAVCAGDLRSIPAPVSPSSLLSHSRSSVVTWWRFSILSKKKKLSLLCWAVHFSWLDAEMVSQRCFLPYLPLSSCPAFWMPPVWLWWMQACRWVACSVEWLAPLTQMGKSLQTPLQLRRRWIRGSCVVINITEHGDAHNNCCWCLFSSVSSKSSEEEKTYKRTYHTNIIKYLPLPHWNEPFVCD